LSSHPRDVVVDRASVKVRVEAWGLDTESVPVPEAEEGMAAAL
jgi:hypothetical protein